MRKKYYIVEFEDGLQIIPNNWFTNGEKIAVYWPNLSSQKEYDTAVEKMKDFNIDSTIIVPVKRIFGDTDIFLNAKNKLKLAEKFSDVNSDEDTDVVKRKRRMYAAKEISSSNSEEESNMPVKKKKIDKYPDVPQTSKRSILHHVILNDTENCAAGSKYNIQDVHDESYYESVSDIHKVKDARILAEKNSIVDNRSQKKTSAQIFHDENRNKEKSQSAKQFYNQDILHENIYDSHTNTTDARILAEKNSIVDNRSQKKTSAQIFHDENRNKEKSLTAKQFYNQDIFHENIYDSHTNTTGFIEFKHHVYKNFAVMKQKLEMILQNQFDLSHELQNNSIFRNSIDNSEEVENIMLQFPTKTKEDLNELEVAIADINYRKNMEKQLSKIGGKTLKSLTLNLMKKMFNLNIAKDYSWYGKKNNKCFSDLKLCSVIINVVHMKYTEATEFEISEPIKTWLRHASEKWKKLETNQQSIDANDTT